MAAGWTFRPRADLLSPLLSASTAPSSLTVIAAIDIVVIDPTVDGVSCAPILGAPLAFSSRWSPPPPHSAVKKPNVREEALPPLAAPPARQRALQGGREGHLPKITVAVAVTVVVARAASLRALRLLSSARSRSLWEAARRRSLGAKKSSSTAKDGSLPPALRPTRRPSARRFCL